MIFQYNIYFFFSAQAAALKFRDIVVARFREPFQEPVIAENDGANFD